MSDTLQLVVKVPSIQPGKNERLVSGIVEQWGRSQLELLQRTGPQISLTLRVEYRERRRQAEAYRTFVEPLKS